MGVITVEKPYMRTILFAHGAAIGCQPVGHSVREGEFVRSHGTLHH